MKRMIEVGFWKSLICALSLYVICMLLLCLNSR